jgi:PPK2 family polyphosphate:nucleotide phosphotransferase
MDQKPMNKHFKISKRFRIDHPEHFHLAAFDPADTAGLDITKDIAKSILAEDIKRLSELQNRLYSQHSWGALVILQGMDASGKDSVIKHVMTGLNPQGVEVHSFKTPSAEELDHDFLWRAAINLPARGRIGIFNRSYYEEVLVVRVHPDLLEHQGLPAELLTHRIWKERFKDIKAFEQHLLRSGFVLFKFHLHVSKQEQSRRLLQRLEDPEKRWKFSKSDVAEHKLWARYMEVYQDMIRHTSTQEAPWYVVPADNKWFSRLVVASVLVETFNQLDLKYPKHEAIDSQELERIRQALLAKG